MEKRIIDGLGSAQLGQRVRGSNPKPAEFFNYQKKQQRGGSSRNGTNRRRGFCHFARQSLHGALPPVTPSEVQALESAYSSHTMKMARISLFMTCRMFYALLKSHSFHMAYSAHKDRSRAPPPRQWPLPLHLTDAYPEKPKSAYALDGNSLQASNAPEGQNSPMGLSHFVQGWPF